MTPVRVLQLATAGPLYGAERWILALMRHLDPARVTCDLAVLDDTPGTVPPLLAAAREAGLTAHAIPCAGRFDTNAARALGRLARAHGYRVLHTHGYKADAIGLLAARRQPMRTVATPHGWSERADWKLRAYEWADRALFALFDAVVPLSPELHSGIAANPLARRKLRMIANGIDLAEVEGARGRAAGLPPLGTGPVIGYCGQLIARKDVSTLLRGFAAWPRRDATLLLVGDGACRGELEAEARALGIAARTTFTGYTPDRLDWMARCDAFVLPSRREGIPRCLMEAMALEVPVLASDIAGNADLVEHGKTGLLFPAGNHHALGGALAALFGEGGADRRAMAGNMARAGRERIEQGHSARAMAQAYAALFEELAPDARAIG